MTSTRGLNACHSPPLDHVPLVSLDVDLEEVDRHVAQRQRDLRERGHRHRDGGGYDAQGGRESLVEFVVAGREARVAPLVEGHTAHRGADGHVEVGVAGSLLDKLAVEAGDRLDVHARPALVVEVLGHRVDDGVVAADVDVAAPLDHVEHAVKDHILEVLCVGDHAALRMMRPIDVEA